ncbi:MAG: S26 family signal peptidase [bacterium]
MNITKPKPCIKKSNIVPILCDGGSMRPVLRANQNILIDQDTAIRLGDCVCYKSTEKNYIHRIISIKNGRYLMASDSNSILSHWIDLDNIVGKVANKNPLLKGFPGLIYHFIIRLFFYTGRLIKKSIIKYEGNRKYF